MTQSIPVREVQRGPVGQDGVYVALSSELKEGGLVEAQFGEGLAAAGIAQEPVQAGKAPALSGGGEGERSPVGGEGPRDGVACQPEDGAAVLL